MEVKQEGGDKAAQTAAGGNRGRAQDKNNSFSNNRNSQDNSQAS